MKWGIFVNKDVYFAAFNVLKTQNNICNMFEDIGLNFEYGSGVIGVALEDLSNQAYSIIKSIMDFNCKTLYRNITINGIQQNICFDVLYIGEYDEDWAITEDDFSDFVHTAIDSKKLQDWFWNAMVDRDEMAKEQFNKFTKMFKIGRHWED